MRDWRLMAKPRMRLRVDYDASWKDEEGGCRVVKFRIGRHIFEVALFEEEGSNGSRIVLLPSFHAYRDFVKLEANENNCAEECLKDLLVGVFDKVDIDDYITEYSPLPEPLLDILVESILSTGCRAHGRCTFATLHERKLANALNGSWSHFRTYDPKDTLHLLNTATCPILVECYALSELKPIKTILLEWAEGKRTVYSLTVVQRSPSSEGFAFSHLEICEMIEELNCEHRFTTKSLEETKMDLKRLTDGETIQFIWKDPDMIFMGQSHYSDYS